MAGGYSGVERIGTLRLLLSSSPAEADDPVATSSARHHPRKRMIQ
jgi:hypothetical protein